MRKKILLLLTLILCITIFVNNANAVESDATMVMTCDCDGPTEVDTMVLYKLTNESGNTFFEFTGDTILGKQNEQSISSWEIGGKKIDAIKKLESGICPKQVLVINGDDFLSGSWDFYEEGSNAKDVIEIEKARYIAYSVKFNKKTYKVIEGYNRNGKYGYAGVDLQSILDTNLLSLMFTDEVSEHQRALIEDSNIGPAKYFKVDEYFPSRMIAGNGEGAFFSVCKGLTEEQCHFDYDYEVLISSSEQGQRDLKNTITEWLNDEDNKMLEGYNKISSLSKDSNFMNTCEGIEEANDNGENYDLSKINIDDFTDKLEDGYKALFEAYNNVVFHDCGASTQTSVTSSVVSCAIYSEKLGIREIADFAAHNKDYMTNQNFLVDNIYSDVKEILREVLKEKGYDINIIDASSDLNKYTKSFYTAALYLNSKGDLTEKQKSKLETIIKLYKKLIDEKELGISPVVDCQTLLGEKLINKIKSYVNIIKIAIPIILILFGIIDFTKAIFAGEEEMQKAKKQFITRIAIAVLIFIAPTIINLLLQLANKVWTFISPEDCGIF